MHELESVQLDFQSEETTLSNVRTNFVEVIEEFTNMEERLKPERRIVHSPTLEDAIVAIQCE